MKPAEVSDAIGQLLIEHIAPDDRAGFLFGTVLAILQFQGFDEDGIRRELMRAIDVVYKKDELS